MTIYWGADKWDAARSLKEMLEEVDESLLYFVNDYKLNLIVPKEIHDFSKFASDFGKAMKYIASSQDKQKMQETAHNERFRFVDIERAHRGRSFWHFYCPEWMDIGWDWYEKVCLMHTRWFLIEL